VTFIAPGAAFHRHHRHCKRREAIQKWPARLDRFAAASSLRGAGLKATLTGHVSDPQALSPIFASFINQINSYPQDD
jgi:hypothetical protein